MPKPTKTGRTWVNDLSVPAAESDEALNLGQVVFESLTRYIEDGIETGGFLRAVLENDLAGAINRASDALIIRGVVLTDLVNLLQGWAPSNCWGSREAVAAWLAQEDS